MLVSAPLTAIGGVFMALREDVGLSWIIAVAVVLLGILIGFLVTHMTPLFRAMQVKVRLAQPGAARADRRAAGDPGLRPGSPPRPSASDHANAELADTATRAGRYMMTMCSRSSW